LVVDVGHPQRVGVTLIVNAHGPNRPAAHDLAHYEYLLRAIEVPAGELVDDLE
jgi:hypothetical protein